MRSSTAPNKFLFFNFSGHGADDVNYDAGVDSDDDVEDHDNRNLIDATISWQRVCCLIGFVFQGLEFAMSVAMSRYQCYVFTSTE